MIGDFPAAAPGFDDPLGMLRACHERILRHGETLVRLAQHLAQTGLDEDARLAARQVHHYFSTAGRHHHQDEEQDVFPRVRAASAEAAALIARLQAEHAEMDRLWVQLAPLLAGLEAVADPAAFRALAGRFRALYQGHIAIENGEFLPRAQALLTAAQLAEIGAAMARRRGVSPP